MFASENTTQDRTPVSVDGEFFRQISQYEGIKEHWVEY